MWRLRGLEELVVEATEGLSCSLPLVQGLGCLLVGDWPAEAFARMWHMSG